MHPKDKTPLNLKENVVYKWSYPEENCNQFYIGKSSRCPENRVREHGSHATSAIYVHC